MKKLFAVLALVLPLLASAGPLDRFTCSLTGVAATLTQCQAAPSAGQRLVITDLTVQTTTATSGQYALQAGTGANCAVGTVAIFPAASTAARWNANTTAQGVTHIRFTTPLVLPEATSLCVMGTATNTIVVQVAGFKT
jgi:hypothetical protein